MYDNLHGYATYWISHHVESYASWSIDVWLHTDLHYLVGISFSVNTLKNKWALNWKIIYKSMLQADPKMLSDLSCPTRVSENEQLFFITLLDKTKLLKVIKNDV